MIEEDWYIPRLQNDFEVLPGSYSKESETEKEGTQKSREAAGVVAGAF